MGINVGFLPVEELIGRGEFMAALELLDNQAGLEKLEPHRYMIVSCELRFWLGHNIETLRRLSPLADRLSDKVLAARAYRILGSAACRTGDFEEGQRHFQSARAASSTPFQLAQVELDSLDSLRGLQPIESALATLQNVRRLVMRSASPHLSVQLRLCLARIEAERGAPCEALKHLEVAGELLTSYPNLQLEAALWVDRSAIAAMKGDIDVSLECARKGADCAERSGSAWSRAAAAINTSHLLGWRGDVDGAERQVKLALGAVGDNHHLRLNALDSSLNSLISGGRYSEADQLIEQIHQLCKDLHLTRRHHDALSDLHSRARLAQLRHRWNEALEELEAGILLSEHSGEHFWRARLTLARARCRAMLGRTTEAIADVLAAGNTDADDLERLTLYHGAFAAVERSHPARARVHLARATRLCAGMSNATLYRDLTSSVESEPSFETQGNSAGGGPKADLESAATLLELAGHPHLLAREAFAILDEGDCADVLVLTTHGERGMTVVASCGSNKPDPPSAASLVDGFETIIVGEHRGETWQILARPRREIPHRCMFIAVRRLVAIAADLNRRRQDERKRAAVWTAETLESDSESIWASEQMAELLTIGRRIAPTPLSVLLTGETGTGKEMLARAIHRASDRADRAFLPFNCTAVPRDMLESQLFGYRKGAFTGADTSFQGVIRSAAGGTLFLDEIADVNVEVQPKLLRFLETHEIHPLGEPQPIKVDVRIVAATNANLEQLVAVGRFREDLFYRLNVIRLKLPPLRERREEIPPLVQHYLRKFCNEQKKGQLTLADETLEYLLLYSWPGNVRQLANEIRRMVALAEPDSTLAPDHLSPEIQASRRTIPAPPAASPVAPSRPELRVALDQPLPTAVEMLEQTMIRSALARSRGRVEEAARLLGISRKGLFLKRRRWNLDEQQAS